MEPRRIQRVQRTEKLSAEEAARIKQLREKIAEELPDIKARAKQRRLEITQAIGALKLERERQGMSLADVWEKTGIERSALSRLENDPHPNPTIATLCRYAEALGKKIVVE